MGKLRWIAIVVFCMLLGGCMQPRIINNQNAVEKLTDTGPKEVVFWHTYSDEETRVFEKEVLPLFHEQHPDVRVIPERVYHTNELKSTLISRATSRKPPDVVRLDIAWVPQFAHIRLLYPVSDFADFADVQSRLHPVALETNYADGKYYGLPLNMNTKAAIFNKELLLEAGYDMPPQSFEEVIQIAKKHNWIIGMDNVLPWASLPYFYALGGSLTDDSYRRATGFLDGDPSIHALERLVELYRAGVLNPHLFNIGGDRWNDVLNGRLFMIDEGPWFYSILQNFGNLQVDIVSSTVVVPFPSADKPASILGGENLVIMKGVRHLDAAWTFMKWMTDRDAQLAMFQTGMIPTNTAVAQSMMNGQEAYIGAYVQAMDQAFLRPPIPNLEAVEKVYVQMMNDIFIHGADIRQAAKEAAEAIDKLL